MALVKEIMSTRIRHVPPDTSLSDAARIMSEFDVGVLPIIREDRIVGVVTDRDIVTRAIAEGRNTDTATVCSVMTEDPICCREDQPVEEVAGTMAEKQVRRMFVVDENEKLSGICSLGDISSGAPAETAGDTLEKVTKPSTE
jgi:CBS domain-containing protein